MTPVTAMTEDDLFDELREWITRSRVLSEHDRERVRSISRELRRRESDRKKGIK